MDDERWRDVLAHRDRLLRIATARCANREDAEDVVQDAMLRCVEFEDLDPERTGAFLTSVTLRLCVDVHRRRERGERAVRRLDPPPDAVDPEELACRASELRRLRDMVGRLPASQRGVLLDRAHGLAMPQIAKRHGLTYKAAESALSRARTALRAALAGSAVVAFGRRLRVGAFAIPAVALAFAVAAIVAQPDHRMPQALVPGSNPLPPVPRPDRPHPAPTAGPEAAATTERPREKVTPSDPNEIARVEDPVLGSRHYVWYSPPPEGEIENLLSCREKTWVDASVDVEPGRSEPIHWYFEQGCGTPS